jgi:Fanconi anemia group M protein
MEDIDKGIKIIIDKRERNNQIFEKFSELGCKVDIAILPVGDYIVSDRICIERKTENDLENSIINARLFEQLERLKKSFEKPMLIIENSDAGFRLNEKVILGAILKIYIDYGVQIIFSDSPESTANIVYEIAKREHSDKRNEPKIVGIKKAYTDYQWQIFLLGSIPGIGSKLAKNMLGHFHTIKNVADADVNELMKVEKIGVKKAKKIYNILNSESI